MSKIEHRLLIADDHALVRAGMRALLAAEPDIEIVGEADNGKDAVRLACQLEPALVLMDISMPGTNGIEAAEQIHKRIPGIKTLMVSMHRTDDHIQAALRAGAAGYLLKDSAAEELLAAIRAVLAGKLYLSPDVSQRLVAGLLRPVAHACETSWDMLSTREREVLKLVAEGNGNRQIAEYLCLSVKTVEKHRSSLMRKLDRHNASSLTAYAIEKRIVMF